MKRLGPMWLREFSSTSLHALGGKLMREYRTDGLSARQDWLLDRITHELAWRMSKRLPSDRCSCELCSARWVAYWGEPGAPRGG